jgi:hypothetical protein
MKKVEIKKFKNFNNQSKIRAKYPPPSAYFPHVNQKKNVELVVV